MATKTIIEKRRVEVCDLCDGEVSKGFREEDKIFDSISCKFFYVYKTPEKFAEYRKSQREAIEVMP